MALESVLKKLESRIEEFVEAHTKVTARVAELQARVAELEEQAGGRGELDDRVAELESQREDLAARLEKVLDALDGALTSAE